LASDSAIADGERDAGDDGGRCWFSAGVLVLRGALEFCDVAFAPWGSAACAELDAGPACVGVCAFSNTHHRGGVGTCSCAAGIAGRCEHGVERRRWRLWQPRRQVAATLSGCRASGRVHDSADRGGAADAWPLFLADSQSGILHGRDGWKESGEENASI